MNRIKKIWKEIEEMHEFYELYKKEYFEKNGLTYKRQNFSKDIYFKMLGVDYFYFQEAVIVKDSLLYNYIWRIENE